MVTENLGNCVWSHFGVRWEVAGMVEFALLPVMIFCCHLRTSQNTWVSAVTNVCVYANMATMTVPVDRVC